MYGIYANIKGVYWWDPCYHIYMDPMGYRYYLKISDWNRVIDLVSGNSWNCGASECKDCLRAVPALETESKNSPMPWLWTTGCAMHLVGSWYLSYVYIYIIFFIYYLYIYILIYIYIILYIYQDIYIKYIDNFGVGAHQKVFGRVHGQTQTRNRLLELLDEHFNIIEFHGTFLQLHCIAFLFCCPTSAGNKDGANHMRKHSSCFSGDVGYPIQVCVCVCWVPSPKLWKPMAAVHTSCTQCPTPCGIRCIAQPTGITGITDVLIL